MGISLVIVEALTSSMVKNNSWPYLTCNSIKFCFFLFWSCMIAMSPFCLKIIFMHYNLLCRTVWVQSWLSVFTFYSPINNNLTWLITNDKCWHTRTLSSSVQCGVGWVTPAWYLAQFRTALQTSSSSRHNCKKYHWNII